MDKRETFDKAQAQGGSFFILVSVDHGAVLPDYLREIQRLDMGAQPIPVDPDVSDSGIVVELSFSRSPFTCTLPWGCFHAVITERWAVSWPLGKSTTPNKPGLKLV